MTLNEAEKVLERDRFDNPDYYLQDFQEAINLGLEAMKRIQRQRLLTIPVNQPPLPGEDIV